MSGPGFRSPGVGRHVAVARGHDLGWFGRNRTPLVQVVFLVVEGDVGAWIRWRGFLTEKTLERTVAGLRYAGWRGDDLSRLAAGHADGLGAILCELDVVEKPGNNGKTYAEVAWVNRYGLNASLENHLDAKDLRLLAGAGQQHARRMRPIDGVPYGGAPIPPLADVRASGSTVPQAASPPTNRSARSAGGQPGGANDVRTSGDDGDFWGTPASAPAAKPTPDPRAPAPPAAPAPSGPGNDDWPERGDDGFARDDREPPYDGPPDEWVSPHERAEQAECLGAPDATNVRAEADRAAPPTKGADPLDGVPDDPPTPLTEDDLPF